jgi:hypothetical protein
VNFGNDCDDNQDSRESDLEVIKLGENQTWRESKLESNVYIALADKYRFWKRFVELEKEVSFEIQCTRMFGGEHIVAGILQLLNFHHNNGKLDQRSVLVGFQSYLLNISPTLPEFQQITLSKYLACHRYDHVHRGFSVPPRST